MYLFRLPQSDGLPQRVAAETAAAVDMAIDRADCTIDFDPNHDTRADGAAIGSGADQLQRNPTVAEAGVLIESVVVFIAGIGAAHLLVDVADEPNLNDSIATATDVGADVRRLDGNEANALQTGLRQDEQTLYAFESGALHVDPMPATISMAAAAMFAN